MRNLPRSSTTRYLCSSPLCHGHEDAQCAHCAAGEEEEDRGMEDDNRPFTSDGGMRRGGGGGGGGGIDFR